IALAVRVLPVPGGPTNKTPFGILAPISWYSLGFFKKLTISSTSSITSSITATSLNVIFLSEGSNFFDRLLLKVMLLFVPERAYLYIQNKNNTITTVGIKLINDVNLHLELKLSL